MNIDAERIGGRSQIGEGSKYERSKSDIEKLTDGFKGEFVDSVRLTRNETRDPVKLMQRASRRILRSRTREMWMGAAKLVHCKKRRRRKGRMEANDPPCIP